MRGAFAALDPSGRIGDECWSDYSRKLGRIADRFGLRATVFALGVTNGAYAVAAIGSMMELVGAGGEHREGVRMGLWGAAQAIAFGIGGFIGTLASDLARLILGAPALSYAAVFAAEAGLFVVSAAMAIWVHRARAVPKPGSRDDVDLSNAAIAGG